MLYRLGLNSWSHTVPFQVARPQEQTAMTSSMKAFKMGIMAHNSNPRTQGAEAEGLQVWGQFGARTSLRKREKKSKKKIEKIYSSSLFTILLYKSLFLPEVFFLSFLFLSALLPHKTACNHTAGHIISKQY